MVNIRASKATGVAPTLVVPITKPTTSGWGWGRNKGRGKEITARSRML